jgi:hypothetical protein
MLDAITTMRFMQERGRERRKEGGGKREEEQEDRRRKRAVKCFCLYTRTSQKKLSMYSRGEPQARIR